MNCVICGALALHGITSDKGPLCKIHLYEHMDIPLGEAQEESACQACRRLIPKNQACYIEDSGFWHEDCLNKYLKKVGKCPKHGSDPRTCGCWGDPIKRLVEQAKMDAQSIWQAGGKHELCAMCLRFNRATAAGLPLHSQEPQRATTICAACYKPICENHTANPPAKNILDLSTEEEYCYSYWTSCCYADLEKKVACSFEHCETTSQHFDRPDPKQWDPLVDSGECNRCGAYYCNWVAKHEQCPNCAGYACEHCGEIYQKDDLRTYEEDAYTIIDLCDDCLEKQEAENEERAFNDDFVRDFRQALTKRFSREGLDLDLYSTEDEVVRELLRKGMDECSIYVEHHREGPHLDILQVAECVDPFDVLSLAGAEINGYQAGLHAPLTRRINRAVKRMQQEFNKGSHAAHRRAALIRQHGRKKVEPRHAKGKKQRAQLREQLRQSIRKNRFWFRSDDPKRRALKRMPKTIKGMKSIFGFWHTPEGKAAAKAKYMPALKKERRKRPNPY